MRLAWVDIKAGAEREAAQREDPGTAAAKIADADRALTVSQVPETAIAAADWETVLELASGDVTRRVDREEIGPGVALSLNERIRLFRDSLDTYLRRK